MRLQSANRDQRGETLPWQRGEEEEGENGLLLFSLPLRVVNILLCPVFLLPPLFILQSFGVFLNAKVHFLFPKCIHIPKDFLRLGLPTQPLPEFLFHPPPPHFPSPTGPPGDTTPPFPSLHMHVF